MDESELEKFLKSLEKRFPVSPMTYSKIKSFSKRIINVDNPDQEQIFLDMISDTFRFGYEHDETRRKLEHEIVDYELEIGKLKNFLTNSVKKLSTLTDLIEQMNLAMDMNIAGLQLQNIPQEKQRMRPKPKSRPASKPKSNSFTKKDDDEKTVYEKLGLKMEPYFVMTEYDLKKPFFTFFIADKKIQKADATNFKKASIYRVSCIGDVVKTTYSDEIIMYKDKKDEAYYFYTSEGPYLIPTANKIKFFIKPLSMAVYEQTLDLHRADDAKVLVMSMISEPVLRKYSELQNNKLAGNISALGFHPDLV